MVLPDVILEQLHLRPHLECEDGAPGGGQGEVEGGVAVVSADVDDVAWREPQQPQQHSPVLVVAGLGEARRVVSTRGRAPHGVADTVPPAEIETKVLAKVRREGPY